MMLMHVINTFPNDLAGNDRFSGHSLYLHSLLQKERITERLKDISLQIIYLSQHVALTIDYSEQTKEKPC